EGASLLQRGASRASSLPHDVPPARAIPHRSPKCARQHPLLAPDMHDPCRRGFVMNSRFLLPVLAAASLAVPAGAQIQRRATIVGGGNGDSGRCYAEVVVDG